MGLEMIIGLIVAALAAIAGAFGLGKSRGTSIAETKADKQRTEEPCSSYRSRRRTPGRDNERSKGCSADC